jgi:hypothetical protein
MRDERLDLFTGSLSYVLSTAELGRKLLYPRGIETMLANKNTELVPESGLAIAVGGLRRELPSVCFWLTASRKSSNLFNRANTDSVCLAQCTVDSTRFSHAHLRTSHEWRNIGRIGIAISDEAFATATLVNSSLEGPPASVGIAEFTDGLKPNSGTAALSC